MLLFSKITHQHTVAAKGQRPFHRQQQPGDEARRKESGAGSPATNRHFSSSSKTPSPVCPRSESLEQTNATQFTQIWPELVAVCRAHHWTQGPAPCLPLLPHTQSGEGERHGCGLLTSKTLNTTSPRYVAQHTMLSQHRQPLSRSDRQRDLRDTPCFKQEEPCEGSQPVRALLAPKRPESSFRILKTFAPTPFPCVAEIATTLLWGSNNKSCQRRKWSGEKK